MDDSQNSKRRKRGMQKYGGVAEKQRRSHVKIERPTKTPN